MEYKLSQSTIEKLGYYVYLLIDPRDNQVFYVGKGCGNRIYQHILGALGSPTKQTRKFQRILDIEKSGKTTEHKVLRHGLTEKEAFEIESAMIDFIGMKNLTNEVLGHHTEERGLMTLGEIKVNYEAEEAQITDPVLLININKRYQKRATSAELYKWTRGNWVVGVNRGKVKYVLTTYRGIVREVYEVESWEKSEEPKRWRFHGTQAPEYIRTKYIDKSIKSSQTQGAQNPIKYVNI